MLNGRPRQKKLYIIVLEIQEMNPTSIMFFVINMFITENVVSRIEFFAPSTKEEANAQQTKLFFLLIITLSDDTLDKDGRESILTNLGLYDEVSDPKQLAGSVTKNGIQYVLEPLVQNDLLFGLSLYTSFSDKTGTN